MWLRGTRHRSLPRRSGHEVFCTDIDEGRIDQLKAGKVPSTRKHLGEVFSVPLEEKKIVYTADAAEAIRAGEVIFICVGTPPKDSGEPDLSQSDHVARQIATEARSPNSWWKKARFPALTGSVCRSASPPIPRMAAASFRSASNPEFLREGTAVADFFPRPHRCRRRGRKSAAVLRENLSPHS